MAVPHQTCLALAVSISWLLSQYAPQFLLNSSVWFTGLAVECALVFIAFSWSVIIYPKLFSPLRHLPQPSGGSFLNGQFWRIFAEPTGHPHSDWIENVPNDGLIYYTSFMNAPRVLVTSIEGLKEVLNSKSYEFVKPSQIAQGIGRILGIGVLFAEGDEHRRQRKALAPAFSFRHIKDLYPVFLAKTRELILAIDASIAEPQAAEENPSNVINVQRWASRSTLDIIGEAGIGKSFNALNRESSELYQVYQRIFRPTNVAKALQLLGLVLPFKVVANMPTKRNQDLKGKSL